MRISDWSSDVCSSDLAAAAVLARFRFDRYRQRRAHGLAQLARDAALLAVGIAAQRMLAPETGGHRVLFIGVVDRRLGLEEILQGQPVRLHKLYEKEGFDDRRDTHDPSTL